MNLINITVATIVLVANINGPSMNAPGEYQEVAPINVWTGKTRDEAHINAVPKNRMVTDSDSWTELWNKWQPEKDLPTVDFTKDFVMVYQVRGPNNIVMSTIELNDGNLVCRPGATRMGGPGFGFALIQLSREGVKKVNDHPLPDVGGEAAENSSTELSFKSISVKMTGGIAGLMQLEEVATDGKIIVKSLKTNSKTGERQLNEKQLKALQEFVAKTSWKDVPEAGKKNPSIPDGMNYVIKLKIDDKTSFKFEYGTMNQNREIQTLLMLVAGQKPRK